ncbi:MAG: hypothetical protein U9O86_04985 [Campylobacterota bacterium]|nr:hypothetical protein [Campylobacterota bacterium]
MIEEWNLKEFISNFQETHRESDIGDNIAIFYSESKNAIKINGTAEKLLNYFKGSVCIYDIDESLDTNSLDVEMISIEEYSDSPYSIYIDENGLVDSYEFEEIDTIEFGGYLLKIEDKHVLTYSRV